MTEGGELQTVFSLSKYYEKLLKVPPASFNPVFLHKQAEINMKGL